MQGNYVKLLRPQARDSGNLKVEARFRATTSHRISHHVSGSISTVGQAWCPEAAYPPSSVNPGRRGKRHRRPRQSEALPGLGPPPCHGGAYPPVQSAADHAVLERERARYDRTVHGRNAVGVSMGSLPTRVLAIFRDPRRAIRENA
jgi:hypothetical protein